MNKIDNQKNSQNLFLLVGLLSLLSILHLWNIPSEDTDVYLIAFSSFYIAVIISSLIFTIKLRGKWKFLTVGNLIIAISLLAYDLFGLALGAMQF